MVRMRRAVAQHQTAWLTRGSVLCSSNSSSEEREVEEEEEEEEGRLNSDGRVSSFLMADSATEDLEPLFDYSRVQPSHVVYLDDESPPVSPKRLKVSHPEGKEDGKVAKFIDCEEEEEEDWLLPPPSKASAVDAKKLGEDSTIKELRLKKQELVSLTQSEVVLQAGGDSENREPGGCLQSSLIEVADEASRPSKRVKIVISIQDKDGLKQFRVYKDDKFERLFNLYADRVKSDLEWLVFSFDGDKIVPTATPLSLGMEDEDIVEVHVKPR